MGNRMSPVTSRPDPQIHPGRLWSNSMVEITKTLDTTVKATEACLVVINYYPPLGLNTALIMPGDY